MVEIRVPVSPGELIDKITILRIKAARIAEPAKLANVRLELARLEETWAASPFAHGDIEADEQALGAVNERLWAIEDEIRANAWLSAPVDSRLIFDLPFESRWQAAGRLLGIELSLISPISGNA